MNVKVKICGIKTNEAAQAASDAGADFLGFNFVPSSKRYIRLEKAKEIIDDLLGTVAKVGVFMDADISEVNKLINYLKLDYVQLHGNELPDYVERIENAQVIKTISLPADFNVEETIKKMKKYRVDYFLLDREIQGRGELLNPKKVCELTSVFPIILGGGLTVENVVNIVQLTKPQIVDVAGGVETNGAKDLEKIKKFIKNAKKYD